MTGKEPTRITERIAREPEAITGPTLTMRLFSFDDSPEATFDLPEGLSQSEQHDCKSFLEAAKQQIIDALQDANVEGAVEALLETRHANALEVRFRGPVSRLKANDSRRVCLPCQVFAMAEPDESDKSTRSFRAFTPAGDFDVTIEVVDAQPGSAAVAAVPTATVSTVAPPFEGTPVAEVSTEAPRSKSPSDRRPPLDIDYHAIFQAFHAQIHQAHAPIRKELELLLTRVAGESFGSLDANRRFASELQHLLNALGLKVWCPTCKQPARFRCGKAGRTRDGSFQFNHARGKKKTTNHGGSKTIPPLNLVPADPHPQRKYM